GGSTAATRTGFSGSWAASGGGAAAGTTPTTSAADGGSEGPSAASSAMGSAAGGVSGPRATAATTGSLLSRRLCSAQTKAPARPSPTPTNSRESRAQRAPLLRDGAGGSGSAATWVGRGGVAFHVEADHGPIVADRRDGAGGIVRIGSANVIGGTVGTRGATP